MAITPQEAMAIRPDEEAWVAKSEATVDDFLRAHYNGEVVRVLVPGAKDMRLSVHSALLSRYVGKGWTASMVQVKGEYEMNLRATHISYSSGRD